MAEIREVRLVDDLDGSPAEHRTEFAVDGKLYEIDLSEANQEQFKKAVGPYVAAARFVRRLPRAGKPLSRPSARRATTEPAANGHATLGEFEIPAKNTPEYAAMLEEGEKLRKQMDAQGREAARKWALGQGMKLGEKGKVPSFALVAYTRARQEVG